MARNKLGTVWVLRRVKHSLREDRQENAYIHPDPRDPSRVVVVVKGFQADGLKSMVVSRSTARLLARRIAQCLEETRG